ncbi:hypothetical protein Hs30E_16620 [Lactococcus hodotermopsidis]|uniref:Uncharacterized protein n=1 Tax=Pseudolactococcus hodotermopsidis TaxID=2709157 RepID=A0A6A0BFQ9_9LACT|nr:hypothetical protein [Lactococcus hodotermopsidis]GFH43111.1 hypothetical protein Hs30E_16620 [Lactococcus hodotermopsidis]
MDFLIKETLLVIIITLSFLLLILLLIMWIGSIVIKNGIQKSGIIEAIDSLANVVERK